MKTRVGHINATYDPGDGPGGDVQPGSGAAGLVVILLLLVGLLFNACQDQPVDNTGISVIRDTIINVRHDTVIVNETDTLVQTIIDTVIVERHDTVKVPVNNWDTVVRHDTLWDTLTRERIDTVDRIVHDTIEVPQQERFRRATLSFQARHDSTGINSPVQKVSVDLTEWLQYKVVDSQGTITGLGLSMSAAMPPAFNRFAVASMQGEYLFYLRGLTLNIPVFRMGPSIGLPDSVPLNRHPFNWMSPLERGGGLMLSAQASQFAAFLQGWTGQVIEGGATAGGERYQSRGVLRFNRVNQDLRLIVVQISGVIFVSMEVNGKPVIERFEILIDLEMGY